MFLFLFPDAGCVHHPYLTFNLSLFTLFDHHHNHHHYHHTHIHTYTQYDITPTYLQPLPQSYDSLLSSLYTV